MDKTLEAFFNKVHCLFLGHPFVEITQFKVTGVNLDESGFHLNGYGQYRCGRCKKILKANEAKRVRIRYSRRSGQCRNLQIIKDLLKNK